MGGSQSKESVSPAPQPVSKPVEEKVVEQQTSPQGGGEEEESKCPMHRGDGSYSYDWTQLFRAASAHGPGGSKPLTKEEQEAAKKNGAPLKLWLARVLAELPLRLQAHAGSGRHA